MAERAQGTKWFTPARHAQTIWTPTETINATIGQPITLTPGLKAQPEIIQWGYRRTQRDSSVVLCEKLGNETPNCLSPFATRMEMTPSYELTIFSVVPSDEGIYRAIVWYIWDEMKSKLINLKVFETISNVTIYVSVGDDQATCHLQCQTAEGTRIIYKWQAQGVDVVNDKHHNISDGGRRLRVMKSVVVPVGESLYKCIASNAVSSDQMEIDLNPDCSTGQSWLTVT
ncbi:hemicentin-1-like [Hemiscyllium ocellatum]|uniref:hemicentin-1-like n=1 Tax=Hemiscyllium ocellatum TaxID=170820 RepID=UPI0029662795|nr:hemicentin-1-like [Hemiscyllium ocellatum]